MSLASPRMGAVGRRSGKAGGARDFLPGSPKPNTKTDLTRSTRHASATDRSTPQLRWVVVLASGTRGPFSSEHFLVCFFYLWLKSFLPSVLRLPRLEGGFGALQGKASLGPMEDSWGSAWSQRAGCRSAGCPLHTPASVVRRRRAHVWFHSFTQVTGSAPKGVLWPAKFEPFDHVHVQYKRF